MNKGIDINVWKFLINRLNEKQKKELITKENIRIGNIQSQLVNKQSQWKIVLNLLNTVLNKKEIQKSIINYYTEILIPNLKEDLKNKAPHLQVLDNMEKESYEIEIKEHGFIYILLYLVSKNDSRANELIGFQPKEAIIEKALDSNSDELAKALEQVRELKKELSPLTKTHKGLQRKFDSLETKHNQMIVQHNNELNKIKASYVKDMEESSSVLDRERQEYKKQLLTLEGENAILKNQLEEHLKKESDTPEENKLLETNNSPEKSSAENKRKKIKVLVFGDLPLNAQKTDTHEFEFFNKDISTYLFNEDYEEYWYVEDKLSAKEKRQLQRNSYSDTIDFEKKNYSKLVR